MDQDLILQNLNEKQKEACRIVEGPILILAGAGTGKTRTITHRVAYLISRGIRPDNILAVTFTNKAALEMKNRIKNLLSFPSPIPHLSSPTICTFHSLCARILRREARHLGFGLNFVIYDEQDQIQLVKKIEEELEIDPKKFAPAMILSMISSAKSELIDFKTYKETYAQDFLTKMIAKIYEPYQRYFFDNNAMDFDDLIFHVVSLFRKRPEILKKYQEKFRYILVDEYQDTNNQEYVLINLLGKDHQNLCVCGDDWQAIYGFRNANVKNIFNFEKNYNGTRVVRLEQNYRSTQNILDAADFVIRQNKEQKEKRLWTKRGEGKKVIFCEVENSHEEGDLVIREITRQKEGVFLARPLNFFDFAVLYRTHAQSRSLEEAFLRHGIPYKIVGGVKFYQRKEIKDIIAYLRLILNSRDEMAFSRIINEPPRGLGKKTVHLIKKFAKEQGLDFVSSLFHLDKISQITPKAKAALLDFVRTYEKLKEKSKRQKLTDLIDLVTRRTGLKEYLRDGTEEGEIRWENARELLTVAKKYEAFGETKGGGQAIQTNSKTKALEAFLEEVALLSEIDEWDEKKDAVTMMTLHAAKGLEFDTVFLVGLEENLLPHSRSLFEIPALEEERRLCYVGMTRAKNYLYLVRAVSRRMFGQNMQNPISRFIENLPKVEVRGEKWEG